MIWINRKEPTPQPLFAHLKIWLKLSFTFRLSLYASITYLWWFPNCKMPGDVGDELFSMIMPVEKNIWTPQITHTNAKDEPYPFNV